MKDNVSEFEKLAFGMFVHFGLYSILGRGEWHLKLNGGRDLKSYRKLKDRFFVKRDWAEKLADTAKRAGCRYITLTARHHDGFSLYDTCGLSDYDSVHSASGRDLVLEFSDACRARGLLPFLYHTFADWNSRDYEENFSVYTEYLYKSVELLCTRYGKIGGIWLDGMWEKPEAEWHEDELYGMIHCLQPEAVIINNSGLSARGHIRHPEIDYVTFERGKPYKLRDTDRHRSGEMCQVLNEHWGYAERDINYKSVAELLSDFIDCRRYNCNFLLNTGLMGDGSMRPIDDCIFSEIGKWIDLSGGIVCRSHGSEFDCEGGTVLTDGKKYYIAVKNVTMDADPNVTIHGKCPFVKVLTGKKIRRAVWLDNGEEICVEDNCFTVKPFWYGTSLCVRFAEIEFEKL